MCRCLLRAQVRELVYVRVSVCASRGVGRRGRAQKVREANRAALVEALDELQKEQHAAISKLIAREEATAAAEDASFAALTARTAAQVCGAGGGGAAGAARAEGATRAAGRRGRVPLRANVPLARRRGGAAAQRAQR